MTDSPWLDTKGAAARSRYSVNTVKRALASEELRGYRRGEHGDWRIHVDDLDAWVRGETADVQVPPVTRRRSA